jgi:AraC-like DNA-binding protein
VSDILSDESEGTMRKFISYSDRVLPVHLLHVLVETAVTHGAAREALFENTGLTTEMLTSPDMRVSYAQWGILIGNALRLTKNPALGIDVGRNTGLAQMGVVGFVLSNSPTLGAALDAGIRYSAALAPGWDFSLDVSGPVATLTVEETIPMNPFRTYAHESVLASFDTQARALARRPLPVRRVAFPFPEPPHARVYRERFYDVEYLFDAERASVEFAFADPATAKLAERYCEQIVVTDASTDGLVGQVRRLLRTASGTPPTLTDLARALQTSTRSLRRELQSMQTSYSDLLDECRRERAEEWMKTNSMPFELLARELGFSHVRSFRRAFKRWTGRTPGSTRARAM